MKRFPPEFSDLLNAKGLRILRGASADRGLFAQSDRYFASFNDLIPARVADDCMNLLDTHLRDSLAVEERCIPPESITEMTENYQETLNKTIHVKTAFFRRRTSRSYRAAEEIGLLRMMRSESFAQFAEALSGLKLNHDRGIQVSCYEQGDYAGPHNDHHPENESFKDGFIDFHVMFSNSAVAHHYLVYEENGHFSKMVNVNMKGGISIYRLPFWHYTTPLMSKRGRETEARRWLLLGSFEIESN
jgi:hypothetical protein